MKPLSPKNSCGPLWRQLWAVVLDLLKQLLPGNWPTLSFALAITLLLLSLVGDCERPPRPLPLLDPEAVVEEEEIQDTPEEIMILIAMTLLMMTMILRVMLQILLLLFTKQSA